jgi:N-methylhydantoinase A
LTRCGADTGGTFTDVVFDDGRVAKVLSTPDDPSRAVASALRDVRPELLAHGTTVATNALIERRGAAVALITSAGLADVIEIARQDRPSLYDIAVERPTPLVSRARRLELGEAGDIPALPEGTDAVAICLLHADLDGQPERAVAMRVAERDRVDITCSSDVSPEFREYERTVTTVVNAYLRPACRPYLQAVDRLGDDVLVMTSAGGLVPAGEAAELPAAVLLSGPAAGARAGALVAAASGFPDAVTFDMGGTSTDVCLVRSGVPEPAPSRVAGGFPIRLPALDIHTIGAGGGSVARIDAGGALVVGPQSAGADPGPACYGRGGRAPTVTDADLVLGRIDAGATFPDLGRLDQDAASRVLRDAGTSAEGIVAVVDAAMEQAVRMVSVERGIDPAGLALVAFGGAGPLHACAIAEAMGMPAVVIPPRAGVLSAVGLLCSPRQRDLVRSWPTPGSREGLDAALRELAARAVEAVGGADAVATTALDCRYAGQSHELTVGELDDFHAEHRLRNGWARIEAPVEVVALRARARRPPVLEMNQLGPPVVKRSPTTGPAVIAEPDCTVWVPAGWQADVDEGGAWILRRSKS